MPLFTQKHYEYLEREIARDEACDEYKKHAADILCRVFASDNRKFKSELFRSSIRGERRW